MTIHDDDDARLTAAEQDRRADQLAERAVAILQQIQATGFFRNNPPAVAQLGQEADLQVLRKRQDFQKLIKSVEDAVAR